ncbi:unnamed protein product [Caenorhabditis nigoni]
MSNPLKTDDKAILSVLLYQFLHEKSAYSSFEEFNKVVKDNFIELDDFEFWFKRFENGKYDERDDSFSISDFKSELSNDKHCLRACIFFEYLKENKIKSKTEFHHNDVFVVYKRMSKVLDIDYSEFDFCFYRFINGVFNLDFEYNPAQIRSFSDLTLETVRKIVENLNFLERCHIRNLSYDLRNIVDDTKIGIDRIDIVFANYEISVLIKTLSFNFIHLKYHQIGDTCVLEFNFERKVFNGKKSLDFASNDLSILLNTSKVGRLDINFKGNKNFINFEKILNSLNTKLHVEHLSLAVYNAEQFIKILSFFKPRTLETIYVRSKNYHLWYYNEIVLREGLKMDQWKQAKVLRWRGYSLPLPLECLSHFCTIREVGLTNVNSQQFQEIKETLLKHHHIEFWRFTWGFHQNVDENEIDNLFGPIEADGARRLEIPNTNAYYQVVDELTAISFSKRY